MLDRGKKALTKVAEWLEAGAPHVDVNGITLVEFDMTVSVDASSVEDCGTACCIAGAVSQFEGLFLNTCDEYEIERFFWAKDRNGDLLDFGGNIQNYLGLTKTQGDKLFIPWDYFDYEYTREFSDPARAAKVIRHLIATGEVDWDKFQMNIDDICPALLEECDKAGVVWF